MGRYDYEPNRINKEDSLEYRYGNNPKVKKEVSLEWRIAKGILIAFVIIFVAVGLVEGIIYKMAMDDMKESFKKANTQIDNAYKKQMDMLKKLSNP